MPDEKERKEQWRTQVCEIGGFALERLAVLVRLMDEPPASGGVSPSRLTVEPPKVATNPEWQWLSEEEQAVVDVLLAAGNAWTIARCLAKRLGREDTSEFRWMLRNLVARRVLLSGNDGYRVNLPERPANGAPA